jgi:N-acetyl-alpha-D-muramate 1-phosphate uridylyltransferase
MEMKAMILAAGRGERLRPLTDVTPKPLLHYQGKPLIEYSLERLRQAGVRDVMINVAYLGAQIMNHCQDGARWQLNIHYSDEGDQALETAGGIAKALSFFEGRPFLVVNADVVSDFPLNCLSILDRGQAYLVMVDNPSHHPQGDFGIDGDNRLSRDVEPRYTYSGIGVYHPDLFADIPPQPLKLRPVLERAINERQLYGSLYQGVWQDVGTVERLLRHD